MKELTFGTMIAVFEEVFGPPIFWAMVVVAVVAGIAFLYVVIRDRALESRRLVRAELWAPLGAILSVWFVMWVTNSGLADIGGPIDVIVLLAIAVVGGIGLTLVVYTAMGLLGRRRPAPDRG